MLCSSHEFTLSSVVSYKHAIPYSFVFSYVCMEEDYMDLSFSSLKVPSFPTVSKTQIAIAAGAAILFLLAGVWVYTTYIKPKLNREFVPNKEFVKGQASPAVATVFLFGTEWCPHCKAAQKPWVDIKEKVKAGGGSVNGVRINFQEVDCDKEEKLASQYNIKGYPTIKYARGNQVIEYDAKPELASLDQFIKQATS